MYGIANSRRNVTAFVVVVAIVMVVIGNSLVQVYKPNIGLAVKYIKEKTVGHIWSDYSCNPSPSAPALCKNSRLTILPGDVIPEEVALAFSPCTDVNVAADASKSVILTTGTCKNCKPYRLTKLPLQERLSSQNMCCKNKVDIFFRLAKYEQMSNDQLESFVECSADKGQVYKQWETISISIILYDGKGRQKTVGGDHLRARILGENGTSIVTGTVDDHDNGSYTAKFEALFAGKITVDVILAYTRETISSMYRVRKELPGIRNIGGQYVNRDITEKTLCHTFPERIPNVTGVCNLTYENSGMPWFCGKPKHRNLICRDLTNVNTHKPYPVLPFTDAEATLIKRRFWPIPNKIILTIEPVRPTVPNTPSSLVPCTKYDTTELWYKREPTGYVDKGQWKLRHCKANSLQILKRCLHGKTVTLFGDSTTRQWFVDFMKRFGCRIISEPWKRSKWHKRAECVSETLQINVQWVPHSQPFFVGSKEDIARYTTYSISRYIDEEIEDDKPAILLLHMYMHFVAYRYDVFQAHVRLVRQSVERLLSRNKLAKVFIKAPHMFQSTLADNVRLNDYFGLVFTRIWFEEFKGLHDQVVFLDHKDITNAFKTKDYHPPKDIVSAMIDQMFSYMC